MSKNYTQLFYENWHAVLGFAFIAAFVISSYAGFGLWFIAITVFLLSALIIVWSIRAIRFKNYLKTRIGNTNFEYLEQLKNAVDSISINEIDGYIYIPLYGKTEPVEKAEIFLRPTANKYPWENKVLAFQFRKDIGDCSYSIAEGTIQSETHNHFVTRAPRTKTKNGKTINRYDFGWVLNNSDSLKRYFEQNFSQNPKKAYQHLFNSESCFQTRTGTKSSWVQGPEYQKCSICKKRMPQIAQICTHEFGYKDFTIYILGCPEHLNETKAIWQCT